jgi:DNA-binding IclR family transcriptional regulator
MAENRGDGPARNQSLVRGIGLLRVLAESPSGGTVPVLADATGLPRTTTARLLRTLLELGAVDRQGRHTWVLGPELARLGRAADPFQQLRNRSRDALAALSAEVHETAMIAAVYDTLEIETILQVDAPTLVGATDWRGRRERGVLHAGAVGKLALADLSDDDVRAVVVHPAALTPKTITSVDELIAELGRVRERGWASTVDELETGLTAVAVPLSDDAVAAAAAVRSLSLSISGLSVRLSADRLPAVAESLKRVSRQLSRAASVRAGRG